MDITQEDIRRILWLRAIEWCSFPSFVSQPLVPILLIRFSILQIVLSIFILEFLWTFLKYSYVNFRLSQYACIFVLKTKWPISIICCIILIIREQYIESTVALLWPFIAGFVHIPGGKVGVIELNLAKQIGYVDQDAEL